MKKILFVLMMAPALLASGQKFDAVAAKAGLVKALDQFYLAYNNKDIKAFSAFLTDDGLYCGSDPKEFWDKATYSKLMGETFADASFVPNIKIDKREIRFYGNGTTAIVVDQFFFAFSPQIPLRQVYHFTKTGTNWLCSFSNTTFIPNNEDIGKIMEAVKPK
jgi:ketosteroid isomerase-like protein